MIINFTYWLPFRLHLGWWSSPSWDDSCSSSVCWLLKITCVTYFRPVNDKKLKNSLDFEICPLGAWDCTWSLRITRHNNCKRVKIESNYGSRSNVDKVSLRQPVIMGTIAPSHRWEKFKFRRLLFRQYLISHKLCSWFHTWFVTEQALSAHWPGCLNRT